MNGTTAAAAEAMAHVSALDFDVDGVKIARVYAEAAWKLATAKKQEQELLEEFHSLVNDILDKNPDLEKFFALDAVSAEKKQVVLDKIFGGRASELVLGLVHTLNRRGRLGLLRAVDFNLQSIWDESRKFKAVEVRTATALSEDQIARLDQILRERFKFEPEIHTKVDPELLGGLWLRVGDMVYDRSLRYSLTKLKDNILARRTNEV